MTLASDAAPGDVLFNGTGTKLAGTEVGPSLIDSFTVSSGGRLTAAPGSPFPAQGLGPFGSEFRPTNADQLFVSNAHNTAHDSGTVSAFKDHRTAGCRRSRAPRSRITRWPRAGWRSPRTASSCSP